MGVVDRREERLVYACLEIGMVLTAKFRDLLGQMIRTDKSVQSDQATSSEA